MQSLYPAESNHLVDVESLSAQREAERGPGVASFPVRADRFFLRR
jgi:hypothetical protein